MTSTDYGVHPNYGDEPNKWEMEKLKASFTHYLRMQLNQTDITLFLDELSIPEADAFIESMEFATIAMREWNNERKADENEDVNS